MRFLRPMMVVWLLGAAAVAGAQQAAPASPANPDGTLDVDLSFQDFTRELEQLPAQIAALEAEQHTIRATLEDGTLYTTDGQRAAALLQRDADIDELLMQALERWTELSDGS